MEFENYERELKYIVTGNTSFDEVLNIFLN